MRTEIREALRSDIIDIVDRNRKDRLRPISPSVNEEAVINGLMSGCSWTLLIDDQIICCFGGIPIGPWTMEVWTLVSSLFFRYPKTCFKAIKQTLDKEMKDRGKVRAQSLIDAKWEWGPRWMEHLGFQKEGVLRSFGPDKGDMVIYSKIYGGEA